MLGNTCDTVPAIEMLAGDEHMQADERTVELIAAHVTAALRDELEAMIAGLTGPAATGRSLTVEQLASRLGVARSTVYAHWREWGGYKLGDGKRAPIRFDPDKLSIARHASAQAGSDQPQPRREPRPGKRRRRALIADAPRLGQPHELHDELV